jgi:uncharacterized protein YggE
MQSRKQDYVSVLGQKVGKAITISDNSQNIIHPMYETMRMAKDESATPRQTLAIGRNKHYNVNVSFCFRIELVPKKQ